jgi:hypothetical protein
LYNGLIAQGFAIPSRNSTAVTLESLKGCYNENFFVFEQKEVNLYASRNYKLTADLEFSYRLIQDYLYQTKKKVLPFKKVPDKNFIIAALISLDPTNQLQMYTDRQKNNMSGN